MFELSKFREISAYSMKTLNKCFPKKLGLYMFVMTNDQFRPVSSRRCSFLFNKILVVF